VWHTPARVIVMKCDLCGNPAVVHETQIRHGLILSVNQCEKHAREAGMLSSDNPPIEGPLEIAVAPTVLLSGAVPLLECLGEPPRATKGLLHRLIEALRRLLWGGREEPPKPPEPPHTLKLWPR
jgi:hypothetical protein